MSVKEDLEREANGRSRKAISFGLIYRLTFCKTTGSAVPRSARQKKGAAGSGIAKMSRGGRHIAARRPYFRVAAPVLRPVPVSRRCPLPARLPPRIFHIVAAVHRPPCPKTASSEYCLIRILPCQTDRRFITHRQRLSPPVRAY